MQFIPDPPELQAVVKAANVAINITSSRDDHARPGSWIRFKVEPPMDESFVRTVMWTAEIDELSAWEYDPRTGEGSYVTDGEFSCLAETGGLWLDFASGRLVGRTARDQPLTLMTPTVKGGVLGNLPSGPASAVQH